MSDLLSDADEDDDIGSRAHAAWMLLVLAFLAVIIIVITVFLSGSSPDGQKGAPVATNPTSSAGSAPAPSSSARRTSPPARKTSTPAPVNTASPCPTSAPCIVQGDVGKAIDAIQRLRAQHNLPRVAGSVSVEAQQCALRQGTGSSCVPHFAWQPVPRPDGAAVVSKVDQQWLLDPRMSSFRVGWAYARGQWECAILKFTG